MRRLFFIVLLAVAILTACTGANPPQATAGPRATVTPLPDRPTPSAAELELSDPTQPIEVAVGDDFAITVRTQPNPTYHWEIAQTFDSNIVEYVWKDHIPDQPGVENSRGKDIWRFKALGPGETLISLGYYQGESLETLQMLAFKVVVK